MPRILALVAYLTAGGVTACGSSSSSGASSSGGSSGSGGVVAAGGSSAKGGQTGVGGASLGAGGVGSGGTAGVGTGGAVGSGGTVVGNGGVAGGGRGGASLAGQGAGGTAASGGASGSLGSGGTQAGSGGVTGKGGSTAGASGTAIDGGAKPDGSAGGDEASFIPDPGWACGMPNGIPAPKPSQLAFSMTLQIGSTRDVGNTPYGHRRLLIVKGGSITGDKLKGSVLTGGMEYELALSNGVVELQGINILKTSDNALIYVRSCGVSPDASTTPRVIPDFEAATSGTYAWLNTGKFVATRAADAAAGTLKLDVYDVSQATVGEPRIQITKPAGVAKQPWDCNTTTGTKGASVFTENVTLGSSISIANAKRGSRNIIPITGGTTTGKVAGAILNGGADYQLSGSLDAWYALAPSDSDVILVRNCGPMGKLIPWFEARTDGPYDFLNTSAYLSSDPGSGSGGVGITFYERK